MEVEKMTLRSISCWVLCWASGVCMFTFNLTIKVMKFVSCFAGLHKLWYPGIRDMSTWSKFGAHGEHGDVFLFSNLGAL